MAADEDEESRMALVGGGVSGGTAGSGNAGSGSTGGGRGGNRVGFVDLLRPFMASVKFW